MNSLNFRSIFVGFPLFLITALTLRGMLFTNFSKSLVGIFNHSAFSISLNFLDEVYAYVSVDSENPIDAQLD